MDPPGQIPSQLPALPKLPTLLRASRRARSIKADGVASKTSSGSPRKDHATSMITGANGPAAVWVKLPPRTHITYMWNDRLCYCSVCYDLAGNGRWPFPLFYFILCRTRWGCNVQFVHIIKAGTNDDGKRLVFGLCLSDASLIRLIFWHHVRGGTED